MAVKFSGCMRSHGVTDFPDPTVGSNGLPNWTLSHITNPLALTTARRACKHDLPDLVQTPAEKATANAAALKYATCMRSNGVSNFPDPNGQGLIQAVNIDASSPAFQKAETACKGLDNGFAEQMGATSASAPPGGAETGS
jgi:hypothetical protein